MSTNSCRSAAVERLDGGDPVEIPLWELYRASGRALAKSDEAARGVVTKHGKPLAFMLSAEAAYEVLVPLMPAIARLRMTAHQELGGGSAVWLGPGVMTSGAVADGLYDGAPMVRGRLRAALCRAARGDEALARVEEVRHVAYFDRCEAGILVYAVIRRNVLERRLFGARVDARLRARFISDVERGRA